MWHMMRQQRSFGNDRDFLRLAPASWAPIDWKPLLEDMRQNYTHPRLLAMANENDRLAAAHGWFV